MDQVHLFGRHVRWSVDLPVPSPGCDGDAYFMAGMRAVQDALAGIPGPVQVNVPFDEPLVEGPDHHPGAWEPVAGSGCGPEFEPAAPLVAEVLALASRARRPLIIAGPETGGLPVDAVTSLSARWGAPVVADPLSGLRAGLRPGDGVAVLDAVDAWIRDVRPPEPDFVLRFGASPTSKALNQFLASLHETPQVLVDLPGGYREPNGTRPIVLHGSPARVAMALHAGKTAADPGWLRQWADADRAARRALDAACAAEDGAFEGRVFAELGRLLPAGMTLVAGNSMPVRDLDDFLGVREAPLDIVANRGVNGIDGVVSSAAGAAAAGRPAVVVVGDVSFLHDLNALWAAREHALPLLIVVLNNDGGGIFHYLPQAAHVDRFERWFATPPRIDPVKAAALFDLAGERLDTWTAFRDALARWAAAPVPTVLEIRTDRAANVEMHRRAWAAAAAAAREVFAS
jgi:2-succinyl-5-enolpyruvyl-6-hydroxy-3-cyclohexene-1-carboxylate synthase